MSELPVLWHLKVSNYNEKARWALDYKGIPHVRRAMVPGTHVQTAERLTGKRTFPILVLEGTAIGDSTDIIAALEGHEPGPPLYPSDPRERRRALDLEDFFDEQLGPAVRRALMHALLADGEVFLDTFVPELPGERRAATLAEFPTFRRTLAERMRADERGAEEAYARIAHAGLRFRAERGPDGYLVGDAFTVADLTAAALVAPAVAPEQFPYPLPRGHPLLARLTSTLEETGLLGWSLRMYERHRGTSSAVAEEPALSAVAEG